MPRHSLSHWPGVGLSAFALSTLACGRASSRVAIAADLQPAVRVALDSFPTLGSKREPLAAETAGRAGDTVIVTLTARRGLLRVWVLNARIVHSSVTLVD